MATRRALTEICVLAVLLLATAPNSAVAQIGPFSAHTSFREVTNLTLGDGTVWAGTSGGVFGYSPNTGTTTKFTIVDGLHSVSIRTVVFDGSRNVLWAGYGDGVLDRLDLQTGEVDSFRDVERATQFSSRQINRLVVNGDSILVATDFGLVVFDAVLNEVRDSYTRLGGFTPAIAVYDALLAELPDGRSGLWLATDEGVAYADFAGINLQDPSAWTNEVLPSGSVTALANFDAGQNMQPPYIYAGTPVGLFRRMPDVTYELRSTTSAVSTFRTAGDQLFALTPFKIFSISAAGEIPLTAEGVGSPTDVAVDGSTLWIGDRDLGLVEASVPDPGSALVDVRGMFVPAGPRDGLFSDISVGREGQVAFGGVDGPNRGFHLLTPEGSWLNYANDLQPEIGPRSSFLHVDIDQDSNIWAGSEGGGVVRVSESQSIERFDETNSSLLPVSTTTDFIIVGGLDNDPQGSLWVTTLGSTRPLHLRTIDGSWTALLPYVGQGLTSSATAYGDLYIDSFEQKWIIVRNESAFSATRGLMILDTKDTPTDQSDDAFRFFGSEGSAGTGLPGTAVTSVVEDRDGLIWIGTNSGLGYMVNTGVITEDPNSVVIWPQNADRSESVFLFLGLPINDLAVDPANRLWVATNEGVRVVEAAEGGFREVLQLSSRTSPLPSDVVVSIAVEPLTGEVFIATEAGTVSTRGEAVESASRLDELFVYPNPAFVADGDQPEIFVEGLTDVTEVTILTAHGALVRRMDARGGRTKWDGRDENGNLVPSGVYLVVAVGEQGEGAGYGKVAVIRTKP